MDKTGLDRTGANGTGVDENGVDRIAVDEAAVDRTAAALLEQGRVKHKSVPRNHFFPWALGGQRAQRGQSSLSCPVNGPQCSACGLGRCGASQTGLNRAPVCTASQGDPLTKALSSAPGRTQACRSPMTSSPETCAGLWGPQLAALRPIQAHTLLVPRPGLCDTHCRDGGESSGMFCQRGGWVPGI